MPLQSRDLTTDEWVDVTKNWLFQLANGFDVASAPLAVSQYASRLIDILPPEWKDAPVSDADPSIDLKGLAEIRRFLKTLTISSTVPSGTSRTAGRLLSWFPPEPPEDPWEVGDVVICTTPRGPTTLHRVQVEGRRTWQTIPYNTEFMVDPIYRLELVIRNSRKIDAR